MANLTQGIRLLPIGKEGRNIDLPVDGGSAIYEGSMVSQLTATGMLVAGSTASSGPAIGVATHDQDNTAGSDGAKRCTVHTDRIFAFANASGGDACSEATLIGSVVYMYDDHTIADNDNSGARQAAGYFAGMEPDGKVRVLIDLARGALESPAFAGAISVDTIAEYTSAAGVTVDGLLVKDGGLPSFLVGITKVQIATGTITNGVCTINTGITVTANTKGFPVPAAVLTGSTNVGTVAHLVASNVVGGAGVGTVVFNVLGDDGAVDADAAGTLHALLVN